MATTFSRDALAILAADPFRMPASQVKQAGWKGVMKSVTQAGAVVITNHEEPQAVILGYEEYEALREALVAARSRAAGSLEALSRDFDERLAGLERAGAAEGLRAVMRGPVRLGGKRKTDRRA